MISQMVMDTLKMEKIFSLNLTTDVFETIEECQESLILVLSLDTAHLFCQ